MLSAVALPFESVIFPESLESIGNDAFSGCTSLKTADLPDNGYRVPQAQFFYNDFSG